MSNAKINQGGNTNTNAKNKKNATPLLLNKKQTNATIGSSFLDESGLTFKTVQGYSVNEGMIAKIDNLEKELIKKKYEL